MVDIAKQVTYWREGAEEALAAARELLEKGRTRFSLFLAHLALEKLLKALVCRETKKLAPRIHNLLQLAGQAQLPLTQEQAKSFAEMNEFCQEGRYPDPGLAPPTASATARHLKRTEELYQWLLQRL